MSPDDLEVLLLFLRPLLLVVICALCLEIKLRFSDICAALKFCIRKRLFQANIFLVQIYKLVKNLALFQLRLEGQKRDGTLQHVGPR